MKAFFAVISICIATCASAQVTRKTPPAWLAWEGCIRDNASKFAKAPDAANLIAGAVATKCKPLLEAFLDSDDDPAADPQKAGEIFRIKNALRDGYVRRALDDATLIVIEARSR